MLFDDDAVEGGAQYVTAQRLPVVGRTEAVVRGSDQFAIEDSLQNTLGKIPVSHNNIG